MASLASRRFDRAKSSTSESPLNAMIPERLTTRFLVGTSPSNRLIVITFTALFDAILADRFGAIAAYLSRATARPCLSVKYR